MAGRRRPGADSGQVAADFSTLGNLVTVQWYKGVVMLEVAIDRDSVHAGDDLGSHATLIKLDPSATLRALIEVIQDAGYLLSINGDKATWVIFFV